MLTYNLFDDGWKNIFNLNDLLIGDDGKNLL